MQLVNTDIIYLDKNDIMREYRDLNVNDISRECIKCYNLIKHASVIILKKDNDYKVLKSRY